MVTGVPGRSGTHGYRCAGQEWYTCKAQHSTRPLIIPMHTQHTHTGQGREGREGGVGGR